MSDSPLTILHSGIEHWNRWRAEQNNKPCSLAGQDLSCGYYFEGDFRNVDLRGANLQKSCLIGANFKGANLTNVNLTNAYVDRAEFEGAVLGGIDLTGTNLTNTNLRQAMSRSRFSSVVAAKPQLTQYSAQQSHQPSQHPLNSGKGAISVGKYMAVNQDPHQSLDAVEDARDLPGNTSSEADAGNGLHHNQNANEAVGEGGVSRLPVVLLSIIFAAVTTTLSGILLAATSDDTAVVVQSPSETVVSDETPATSKTIAEPPQRIVQAATDLALVKTIDVSSQVWAVETHAREDGRVLIASGDADGEINVWDGPTGEVLHRLTGHNDTVRDLAISPSGKRLVSSSGDGIKVWQPQTGKLLYSAPAEPGVPIWSVAISPDEKTFISGDYAGNITHWSLDTGKQLYRVALQGPVWSLAIAPDGKSFVSGGDGSVVRHWDLATGEPIGSFAGHTDTVRAVDISADGKTLASGSWDSTINLWDVTSGELTATLSGHSDRVVSIAISPDGTMLASSSVDSTLKTWSIPNRKLIETLDDSDGWVLAVAFDLVEQTLVSGEKNKRIKMWQ